MENLEFRDEAVKSLRNRCDAYLLLRNQTIPYSLEELCATILEDIVYFAHEIGDEYCIERDIRK